MIVKNKKNEEQEIFFKNVIIAVGSKPIAIPGFPNEDDRVMDSTSALELKEIPNKLLIIGAGIIGLELSTVYANLGSQVTIVENMAQAIHAADADLVKPLTNHYEKIHGVKFLLETKVLKLESKQEGLTATLINKQNEKTEMIFDRVLVCVGRKSNAPLLNLEKINLDLTQNGLIEVNALQQSKISHIYAIGDCVYSSGPINAQLAHKASYEAKIAAEVIAGHKSGNDAKVIPSVAYTDPEIAWVGLTEKEAKEKNIAYEKASFPWAASGRNLTMGRNQGISNILVDPKTKMILGAGVVGANAGELITQMALAIEMQTHVEDLALTIHPHPTLSETWAFSAEVYNKSITDLLVR